MRSGEAGARKPYFVLWLRAHQATHAAFAGSGFESNSTRRLLTFHMIVELHAKSDIGRVRRANEDNFLVLNLSTEQAWSISNSEAVPAGINRFELGDAGLVLMVSDGMGGALAGDVASLMAVETVREVLTGAEEAQAVTVSSASDQALADRLFDAALYANAAINHRSLVDPQCSGMGATLTGAAITSDLQVKFVQVGDSRAYLIRGDHITLATKDQSLVQQLVDEERLTEEEAETHPLRNIILQALGAQKELVPVAGHAELRRGDVLLLCSDGLSGKLRAEDMQRIVAETGDDLAAACDQLINEANARGGEDNITVVLARFTGDDLAAPGSEGASVGTLPGSADTAELLRNSHLLP